MKKLIIPEAFLLYAFNHLCHRYNKHMDAKWLHTAITKLMVSEGFKTLVPEEFE